ncbi:DEAD/DEAH box helicase family protein [Sphingomonas oryzagri]
MNTIHYVSAPAGSGKTHNLIHWAIDEARRGEKIIIAQPTMELIDQTYAKLKRRASDISIQSIYRRYDYDVVAPKIAAHMKASVPDQGEILLITHEALRRLQDKGHFVHWQLVVDEFMSVFEHIELKIALTHRIVTDHLEASEEIREGIASVQATDTSALEELVTNRKDDMNVENFLPLLRPVLGRDQKVYVGTKAYADLIENPDTMGHVDFFAILEPTFVQGFKSVTFMGANAEQTEMFVLWNELFDVDWQKHSDLGSKLLYDKHPSGSRLTVSYLFDENWSKTQAKAEDVDGTTLQKVQRFIHKHFESERFLWHANASVSDRFFNPYDRLPSLAHGLDREDYRKCNRVVLLSALNRKPAAYAFLDKLGIDNHVAHAMIGYQSDYQSMMRCSLRDPSAIAEVEVVVMSKGSAEWIEQRFPGCEVRKLDTGISGARKRGRPAVGDRPMTTKERNDRRAAKKAVGKVEAAHAAEDQRKAAIARLRGPDHSE